DFPNLYYPVVDVNKSLLGIITIDNIKNTFMATSLNDLILAVDVMEPAIASITPNSSISELKNIFAKYNLEYLPVVNSNNKVVGFTERRMVYKIISTRVMELQRQADSLEIKS
ncbi:MAG: CBS domain-containing protein, partial [Candidatus Susulua stagnicola]|nr:CBS domain-containing protein [Candidatus Susulua stagnicola]